MRKTLLFDLDGTLLNTLEDLRDSTNFALRTYGYPERSLEEVRRFVGNGLKMLLTRAVPQGSSEAEIERALACMKAHYCKNYHNKTVPYPGIPELLQRLQQAGFRMAIVSNKADPAVQLIRTLYFDGIIDVAVGESPACSKKPAPDMVLAALQRLGSTADDAIYLGDSEVDLQTAKNSGLPCATVGWGFRTEIGSAVFTNYESYKKFMPEPERWPASPEMLDKHFFGNSAGNARPTRYFAAVEYNYGKAAGAEDFCRKAQLLNIEVNKAMYEGWQHHLWNDASGILTWMSQSAYPSFVWQTYDYYYDLNGAYWGVRKACEPLHIQWSYADNTVKVVNASGEAYNGLRATAAVYNMDGSEVKRYAQQAALSSLPNTAVKVMTLPFPEDRNLARGKKTVASSSENDDSHAAKSVTDGNTGSSWRSGGPGEQWVMVDLGAPTEFSDIVLTWESEAAKAYEILASDDASTWRTVYTSGKPSTPIDQIRIDPVTARYVKLQGTAPHDDWQLVLFEMELYGPETPAEELSPVHFIRLRLTDDAGNLLSENFYWRSNRLGDYRALNDLEPAKLDVRTKAETVDGKRIIRATVTNRGRSVAFAVRLMPVYASTGEQILPVIMDDNYFTLLRGETRKVDIEIDESLLGEDTYKLVARPYND